MFSFIKKLFKSPNFAALVQQGAIIIDVRTEQEYAQGHIDGSLNMPLAVLSSSLPKYSIETPLITCCASGVRSAAGKAILSQKGYKTVFNGGGWKSLQGKIKLN